MLRTLFTVLLLPPVNLAGVGLAALLIAGQKRAGRAVAILALMGLLVFSLPVTAVFLLASLDPGPLAPPSIPPAAIVVLGGDVQKINDAPGVTLGPLSLERVRAGAVLYRKTGLPVLLSGGIVNKTPLAVGTLMAASMVEDFSVPVRWIEAVSFDTWENAEQSAALLAADGVSTVFLVTHAWHMRRSLLAFQQAGITAVPAPVRRDRWPALQASEFVPAASSWLTTYYALHEWLGILFYKLRTLW